MTERNPNLSILQISTSDIGGGAELTAMNLFNEYIKNGYESSIAVGEKTKTDPRIYFIDNKKYKNKGYKFWNNLLSKYDAKKHLIKGIGRTLRFLRMISEPLRELRLQLGRDEFNFLGSKNIINQLSFKPDIIHCHNLHGNYFDLREIEFLSKKYPVIITMHDAWLLSGHCAFSLSCNKWKYGCGGCPDLNIFPAIKRDASKYNWRFKHKIFQASKIYLITPSNWLMGKTKKSLLSNSIIISKVIPNGIDTKIFHQFDKSKMRKMFGIKDNAKVLMMAANGIKNNLWKDYQMMIKAIEQLPDYKNLVVLAVGEVAPMEVIGNIEIKFIPFIHDQNILAQYYSAADVYLHTAKVESFGNVLLEARACGTPIISTNVGGIPEHVNNLVVDLDQDLTQTILRDKVDGILCKSGDEKELSEAIKFLLDNPELCELMSLNGMNNISNNFSIELQAKRHIQFYQKVINVQQ